MAGQLAISPPKLFAKRQRGVSRLYWQLLFPWHRSVPEPVSRLKPDTSAECKLYLEVTLLDLKMTEGSVTEARVEVTNRSHETVPAPIAIIGQLKELVKAGTITAYEVAGA